MDGCFKIALTTQVNIVSVELMGAATRLEGVSHGAAVGVITANTLLPTEVPPFSRATTWTSYKVKGTGSSLVACHCRHGDGIRTRQHSDGISLVFRSRHHHSNQVLVRPRDSCIVAPSDHIMAVPLRASMLITSGMATGGGGGGGEGGGAKHTLYQATVRSEGIM